MTRILDFAAIWSRKGFTAWAHKYVIMPNHIHAIVEIVNPKHKKHRLKNQFQIVDYHGRMVVVVIVVATTMTMPVRQPKSISSFMAGFKAAVNSKIDDFIDDNNLDIPKYNCNNRFFQRNYHDRVIRNPTEYRRIKYYIRNNPQNWKGDDLLPE